MKHNRKAHNEKQQSPVHLQHPQFHFSEEMIRNGFSIHSGDYSYITWFIDISTYRFKGIGFS